MYFLALSELSDASLPGLPTDATAPKFIQLLKDTTSIEGQRVQFECRVIGNPKPDVKWYRDHQLIHTSAYYEVFIIGNV